METAKTVRVHDTTINRLNDLRTHKRETWDDLINKSLEDSE